MRVSAILLLAASAPSLALAQDCEPLRPVSPASTKEEFSGTIRGEVDGLFLKLAELDAEVEGKYSRIAENVLIQMPEANHLYIWERLIYLECTLIAESKDISYMEKLKRVETLYPKLREEPPALSQIQRIEGDKNLSIQDSDVKIDGGVRIQ